MSTRYRETDRPPRHIDHVLFIDATPGEQGYNCFVRHNQGRVLEGTATHWRVNSSAIIHGKLDDGTSLSDHCGVSVTLRKCDHPSPPAAVATASDGLGACGGVESWAEAASTLAAQRTVFGARCLRPFGVGMTVRAVGGKKKVKEKKRKERKQRPEEKKGRQLRGKEREGKHSQKASENVADCSVMV